MTGSRDWNASIRPSGSRMLNLARSPFGKPVEVRPGIINFCAIRLRAMLFRVFIGIEAAFEFHDTDAHTFIEQQFDRAVRRLSNRRRQGSKFRCRFCDWRFIARICSVGKRGCRHVRTASMTPAWVAPITSNILPQNHADRSAWRSFRADSGCRGCAISCRSRFPANSCT